MPRVPSPEIDTMLGQIERWSPQPRASPKQLRKAGFAVFSMDLPVTPVSNADLDAPEKSPENGGARPIASKNNIATLTVALDSQATALALPQTPFSLRRQSDGTHSALAEAMVRAANQPNQPSETQYYNTRNHLDALQMPATQKRLIHHWVTFTSRKLCLLDEPHNPCRTMMLPMALQGMVSRSDESNASVAIFHALCAAASCNLFELGGRRNEQDRVVALHHDELAIQHLGNNLARADEHTDQSFAMAIMACIMVDAISGTTKRWRTHVSGGLAYLAKLSSRGVNETMLAAFRRHMVSMAILCDVPVDQEQKAFLQDPKLSDSLETTFPYYGVSRAFLQAHDRMNDLSALPNHILVGMDKDLEAFELQLYLNFPAPPAQLFANPADRQGLILHHIAKVFYYAHLVFFKRSIRRVPRAEVQTLIDLGIGEVEALEKTGGGDLGCIMMWPVLVLGAECSPQGDGGGGLRQRMKVWFREQKKLGFRNLVVLEDLIEAVWGANGDDADWRDYIVHAKFDVFRL